MSYSAEYFKKLLTENQLEKLINELISAANYYNAANQNTLKKEYDAIILISRRYYELKYSKTINVISNTEFNIEMSNIGLSILYLLNDLPEKFYFMSNSNPLVEIDQYIDANSIQKNAQLEKGNWKSKVLLRTRRQIKVLITNSTMRYEIFIDIPFWDYFNLAKVVVNGSIVFSGEDLPTRVQYSEENDIVVMDFDYKGINIIKLCNISINGNLICQLK